jgi:group I intron endonuclease
MLNKRMSIRSKYPNKAGIYKLIDRTGKVYIGKSTNLRIRLNAHKNYKHDDKSNSYLKNAILKYGWSFFNVEILEIFDNFDKNKDNEYLLERESYYIKLFDSTNKDSGYNICIFSTDRTGIPMTEDSKQKVREARLGKKLSEETKQKMRDAKLGKKFTEEHKQKLRDAKIKNPMSLEHKEKLRLSNVGKQLSESTKEKIRQHRLGKKASDETKKKLKRPCSEETKEKIRNANLGKKHSKKSIEKMRLAKIGKLKNKKYE